MAAVEVIVPWRGGCAHREQAWDWLFRRWVLAFPWPVTLAECPPGPWCKAAAVMPVASASRADVLVIADADVWCDGVDEAVDAVTGGAPWAIPHGPLHRLTEVGTAAVLAGAEWPTTKTALAERPYHGHAGGGIVVVPKATLLDIPPDSRFVGWGGEDDSWGDALEVLAGRSWRGTSVLWHLWHPPQPRINRYVGSEAGRVLRQRYVKARRSPVVMRALVNEAKETAWQSASASR